MWLKNFKILTLLAMVNILAGCNKSKPQIPQPKEQLPDLIATSLTVTYFSDTLIKYSYTIKNIGEARANMDGLTTADDDNLSVGACQTEDTISSVSDVPAGGTIVGSSPLGFLIPGQSRSGSFHFYFYNIDRAKYRYLKLIVDVKSSVKESYENNNTIFCKIN